MSLKPEVQAALDAAIEGISKTSRLTDDPVFRAMAAAAVVYMLVDKGTPAAHRPPSVNAMLAGAQVVIDDPRLLDYLVTDEKPKRSRSKKPDKELAELRKMAGLE